MCYNLLIMEEALRQRIEARTREHHGVSGAVRTTLRDAVFGTQDGLIPYLTLVP